MIICVERRPAEQFPSWVCQWVMLRITPIARVLLLLLFAGCDEPSTVQACQAAGLCDPPPPPESEEIVLLADPSPGSVASLATLGPVLDAVLARAITRPGSTIAVRVVGPDDESSREIVSVVVPEPPRRLRSPQLHEERTVSALRSEILTRITPTLEEGDDQQASAIAASLTLLGRTPRRASRRWILAMSDLRERSRPWLDLETRRCLPTQIQFERLLDRRGLLQPGTFTSADEVQLLDLGLPHLPNCPRCPGGIGRADGLRSLWIAALERAGAGTVVVRGRVPVFDPPPTDTEPPTLTNHTEH